MQKAVQTNGDVDISAETALFMPAYQQDPEGSFFFSLIDRTIIEMIQRIPPEFRDVVLLSDLEGLTYAEMADLLEVPIGTIKSRLFRGRRLLQDRLYHFAAEAGYLQPNNDRALTAVAS
jgi:RNA polymerase sigma-70 factor, ECF subfamily